tara:strand:+ start:1109 stop:1351 length:243 start_codon:yes stop_codon:yes gene_type:complete
MVEPITRINRPIKKMLWQNFLGGIAWGLGVTIGLSIVFALLGYLLTQINLVPVLGDLTSQVIEFVNSNKNQSPSIRPFEP